MLFFWWTMFIAVVSNGQQSLATGREADEITEKVHKLVLKWKAALLSKNDSLFDDPTPLMEAMVKAECEVAQEAKQQLATELDNGTVLEMDGQCDVMRSSEIFEGNESSFVGKVADAFGKNGTKLVEQLVTVEKGHKISIDGFFGTLSEYVAQASKEGVYQLLAAMTEFLDIVGQHIGEGEEGSANMDHGGEIKGSKSSGGGEIKGSKSSDGGEIRGRANAEKTAGETSNVSKAKKNAEMSGAKAKSKGKRVVRKANAAEMEGGSNALTDAGGQQSNALLRKTAHNLEDDDADVRLRKEAERDVENARVIIRKTLAAKHSVLMPSDLLRLVMGLLGPMLRTNPEHPGSTADAAATGESPAGRRGKRHFHSAKRDRVAMALMFGASLVFVFLLLFVLDLLFTVGNSVIDFSFPLIIPETRVIPFFVSLFLFNLFRKMDFYGSFSYNVRRFSRNH